MPASILRVADVRPNERKKKRDVTHIETYVSGVAISKNGEIATVVGRTNKCAKLKCGPAKLQTLEKK